MNALTLCLLAVLSADADEPVRFYTAPEVYAAAIRGQSPTTYDDPSLAAPAVTAQEAVPGQAPVFGEPPPGNFTYDPFLGGAPMVAGVEPNSGMGFGLVGPQAYRMGWSSAYDTGYITPSGTSGGPGNFSIFEVNAAVRRTSGWQLPGAPLLFSWTPEFNYRSWNGPGFDSLPPNVYRFASDFELATPTNAPFSLQLGFTPALVSDFVAPINRDGFNFDGRMVMFLRSSPTLQFAVGAMYLNRVRNQVLPYAGVIWTPNDRWDLRLMFPKSRISYFVGDVWGSATWLYGGVEYNIEAYEIELTGPNGNHEKIQLLDYRAMLGIRGDRMGVSSFAEAGLVFGRKVGFLQGTQGFDVDNGFMARVGLRF